MARVAADWGGGGGVVGGRAGPREDISGEGLELRVGGRRERIAAAATAAARGSCQAGETRCRRRGSAGATLRRSPRKTLETGSAAAEGGPVRHQPATMLMSVMTAMMMVVVVAMMVTVIAILVTMTIVVMVIIYGFGDMVMVIWYEREIPARITSEQHPLLQDVPNMLL